MHLTTQQIADLRTFVFASSVPAIVTARNGGMTYDLSLLLSAPAVPTVLAWRVDVPAIVMDDAANYTTFDGKTQGKRDEWSIFLRYAPRNLAKAKNRNVVTDVWGAATGGSVAEAVLLACVEPANVAEVALGGSVTSTGTVSATERAYVGPISQEDARLILAA
jgi:hypothetical protein